jgi:transcriptional regulator NrdR family protein
MGCPECGGKNTVVDTRFDSDSIHRKRKCDVCGHVFFTEEYEAITSDRFFELRSEYDKRRRDNGKGRKN